MNIGVCDAERRAAWALYTETGNMARFVHEQHTQDHETWWAWWILGNSTWQDGHEPDPPAGFPDGNQWLPADPVNDALAGETSAGITVIVNADEGSLAFRVNHGPCLPALTGFPRGVPLRPYVSSNWPGDRVTIEMWLRTEVANDRL